LLLLLLPRPWNELRMSGELQEAGLPSPNKPSTLQIAQHQIAHEVTKQCKSMFKMPVK
jgi:hypothetical protein